MTSMSEVEPDAVFVTLFLQPMRFTENLENFFLDKVDLMKGGIEFPSETVKSLHETVWSGYFAASGGLVNGEGVGVVRDRDRDRECVCVSVCV